MARKSWHLDRRTFLHGLGVTVALPMFESMAASAKQSKQPPRMACVYFANGVSLPPEKHEDHKKWHWFPLGEGKDYQLTDTLRPLDSFRDDMTILGGLSHPLGRRLVGHATADIWLTGGDVRGSDYKNTISIDQAAAIKHGPQTRIPSLVLSSNGGVGYKTRTATVSFDQKGEAIPAESMPRQIFDRMFSQGDGSKDDRKAKLQHDRRIVDLVLDESKSLRNRLGKIDQRKLDEYLNSVHEIEQRIQRTESWLGTPVPAVDPESLNLESRQDAPKDYIRTIYDLMFLAFQTDTTRVATFQVSQEDGKGVSDKFPAVALGLNGHHGLSHGTGKDKGYEKWALYDQFLADQLAYFLKRLKSEQESEGSLLDHTMVLFGSATSTTHNANNYPLVLAGGGKLGCHHGEFRKYTDQTPLANLFVTMLNRMDLPVDRFADSTGSMTEV